MSSRRQTPEDIFMEEIQAKIKGEQLARREK